MSCPLASSVAFDQFSSSMTATVCQCKQAGERCCTAIGGQCGVGADLLQPHPQRDEETRRAGQASGSQGATRQWPRTQNPMFPRRLRASRSCRHCCSSCCCSRSVGGSIRLIGDIQLRRIPREISVQLWHYM